MLYLKYLAWREVVLLWNLNGIRHFINLLHALYLFFSTKFYFVFCLCLSIIALCQFSLFNHAQVTIVPLDGATVYCNLSESKTESAFMLVFQPILFFIEYCSLDLSSLTVGDIWSSNITLPILQAESPSFIIQNAGAPWPEIFSVDKNGQF